MILNLNDTFFTKDPFEVMRSSNISRDEWDRIWYKRRFLEYRINELVDYMTAIMGKEINEKQLSRLLMRYEVWILTQPLLNRREQTIHISFYPKNVISFIKDYYHGQQDTKREGQRDVPRDDREVPAGTQDALQVASD